MAKKRSFLGELGDKIIGALTVKPKDAPVSIGGGKNAIRKKNKDTKKKLDEAADTAPKKKKK